AETGRKDPNLEGRGAWGWFGMGAGPMGHPPHPTLTSLLRSPRQIQQFSKKEIEDLLRKGAYAAIMEEDDEGSKFCEEDIDQILLRRTTTITIESEGKGSTFAKVFPRCLVEKADGVQVRLCRGGNRE
uniref:Uncharacterized protein n=1 Tax=Accipiter nisus TaxID=211598 RepID=A0A8B9MUK0_9AVES